MGATIYLSIYHYPLSLFRNDTIYSPVLYSGLIMSCVFSMKSLAEPFLVNNWFKSVLLFFAIPNLKNQVYPTIYP